MGNFEKLNVWNKAVDLAVEIYSVTKVGVIAKDFGMKDQIQRSAVSISSNIAEGDELKSNAQAIKHFYYSKGSSAELMTQLIICKRIGYIETEHADSLIFKCKEISRMLQAIIVHRTAV